MPLNNFGGILAFAAELEQADADFYRALADNPALGDLAPVCARFAADEAKNLEAVLRTRRENVTEMILEPVRDFSRAPFQAVRPAPAGLDRAAALAAAREIEAKALDFFTQAASKLAAMPEVSRALKLLAKKRGKHQEELAGL